MYTLHLFYNRLSFPLLTDDSPLVLISDINSMYGLLFIDKLQVVHKFSPSVCSVPSEYCFTHSLRHAKESRWVGTAGNCVNISSVESVLAAI